MKANEKVRKIKSQPEEKSISDVMFELEEAVREAEKTKELFCMIQAVYLSDYDYIAENKENFDVAVQLLQSQTEATAENLRAKFDKVCGLVHNLSEKPNEPSAA